MTAEVWDLGRSGELADVYNEQIACVPYSFPVTTSTMASAAQRVHNGLECERLVVGVRGASIESFAHTGVLNVSGTREGDEMQSRCGLIRMLIANPRSISEAKGVLERVESGFRDLGITQIRAFDDASYYFYRYTTPFLTDRWPPTWSLLRSQGFESIHKGQFFDWRDFQVAEPAHSDASLHLRFEQRQGAGVRPNLTVEAMRGDEAISRVLLTALDHYSGAPEASDVCYVDGFGTSDHERRKGIGRFAMLGPSTEWDSLGTATSSSTQIGTTYLRN